MKINPKKKFPWKKIYKASFGADAYYFNGMGRGQIFRLVISKNMNQPAWVFDNRVLLVKEICSTSLTLAAR